MCEGLWPLRAYAALFFALRYGRRVAAIRSAARLCARAVALARIRRANNAELNDVLASVFQLVKVPLPFR